jgi:hypothetical protein
VAPKPPTQHCPWPILRFSCTCELARDLSGPASRRPQQNSGSTPASPEKSISILRCQHQYTFRPPINATPPSTLEPIPSNNELMSRLPDLPNIQSSSRQSFQIFLPSTSSTRTFPVLGSILRTTMTHPRAVLDEPGRRSAYGFPSTASGMSWTTFQPRRHPPHPTPRPTPVRPSRPGHPTRRRPTRRLSTYGSRKPAVASSTRRQCPKVRLSRLMPRR